MAADPPESSIELGRVKPIRFEQLCTQASPQFFSCHQACRQRDSQAATAAASTPGAELIHSFAWTLIEVTV